MKIIFDHESGFGKVEQLDFIHSPHYGIMEPNDKYDDVLGNGWIPWEDKFYNVRSVRIDVSEYFNRFKKLKFGDITCEIKNNISDAENDIFHTIYHKYCMYHEFKRDISLSRIINASDIYFIFSDSNNCIGCTFSKLYEKSLVSNQFIYDYSWNKLSVGSLSQYYECLFAKNNNIDYVYILGGYELSSKYKMNIHGAEWWTGSVWSKDKKRYNDLCDRDTGIVIHDL